MLKKKSLTKKINNCHQDANKNARHSLWLFQSSCFLKGREKKLVIFPIFWSSGFYVYQLDSMIMQEWYFISLTTTLLPIFNLSEFLVHCVEESLY